MEECTTCETSFKDGRPLEMEVSDSASDLLIYATNTGKNIILIRRIIVCRNWPSGGRTLTYHRDTSSGTFGFQIGGARIEPGTSQLKVRISKGSAISAQAQAEYYEVPCRETSCNYTI